MKRLATLALYIVAGSVILTGFAQPVAVADGPEPLSLSQCGGNGFCGWASTGFAGVVDAVSGSGVSRNVTTWDKQSYYNNRSLAAKLYNHNGTAYLCFAPGESRSSVGAGYEHPSVVYLSSATTC